MRRTLPFRLSLFAALAVLSTACGRLQELDDAEDADESVDVTSAESALTSTLSDEVSQPMSATATDMAMGAATRVGALLKPQGCATQAVNGATVTYTLTNCTGPYGLVKMNGVITAVYSRAAGGGVQVVLSSTGFKANNATFDLAATVVATQSNGVRTAAVTADSKGTGARGVEVTRQGTYTVVYEPGAECIAVDGTWTTKSGGRTGTTNVVGYKRCKGECPKAGGRIVHTNGARPANSVTVTYDGSAIAKWAVGARSGTVNLRCGGADGGM